MSWHPHTNTQMCLPLAVVVEAHALIFHSHTATVELQTGLLMSVEPVVNGLVEGWTEASAVALQQTLTLISQCPYINLHGYTYC